METYTAAMWETEDEYSGPVNGSLPTPQDTPYRTPSRNSRKSRRSITPPGSKSSSPPPLPSSAAMSDKRSSKDLATDETISILDPRRFTPTLHANLVSEILTLRRDQEEKMKIIESLEASLQTSREEHESLQSSMLGTAKESRSLKRQLALLEGGTSSALGELARERDEAVDTATETKKRLEAAQKKLKSLEEDSNRVHDQWAKEKDAWEESKRKYERKVHVAESRLKVVLDEVAAYQAAHMNGHHDVHESDVDDHGKDTDAASIRTMSMTNSVRFSVLNGNGAVKLPGNSLADELNFDGDSDDQTDHDGRESTFSNGRNHNRNASRDSAISRLHRRNQSIESLKRPGSVARGRLFANPSVVDILEDGIIQEDEVPKARTPKPSYADTGIQYSPPSSPKLQPVSKPSTPEPPKIERLSEFESPPRGEWEIEANQRRKRVHATRPLVIETALRNQMVSASSQTMDGPLSPPKTPKSPLRSPATPSLPEIKTPSMVSSSTQTDKVVPSPEFFPMLSIPSISVVPPTSRPTTPREPRLPQYFKHVGVQVSMATRVPATSIGIQTEEIRVDKRLAQLPAHLRPDAINSRPPSPGTSSIINEDGRQFTPVPGNLPPRNPRRLATKRSLTDMPSSPPTSAVYDTQDAYPGNNDDGPLSQQGRSSIRRPHRFSSLFAGFDAGSSDEADEFGGEGDLSDSEFRTALTAPKPKGSVMRPAKRSSSGMMATFVSPEVVTVKPSVRNSAKFSSSDASSMKAGGTEIYSSFSLDKQEPATRKPSLKSAPSRPYEKQGGIGLTGNKQGIMRKAAMIQNGIATHIRPRSPSLPDWRDPPFPIPTRASSRRPPISSSAPSDGQRSPTRMDGSWHRRGLGRSAYRANSIRKVRSAAAIPRSQQYRRRSSRSPPPFGSALEAPESPGLPPLPNNDITTPRGREATAPRYMHHAQNSTNTANTNATDPASQASNPQTMGVVDAIAQTMVGEWMFKYVRRRKSFGVPETNGRDDNSNDRHKRWVWLAPYERAILWSSKQPSSNSALMGKAGRKLTIQSVLDVKDDNPSPKGVAPLFNRSILILTPQRALKFTATSPERHYVWLTALSFLAHSSQAVPEIVGMAAPKPVPDFELPRAKLRKPGIRDSIRLAKGKTPSFKAPSIPSIPSLPSIPPSRMESHMEIAFREESYAALTNNSSVHQRDGSREAAEPPYIPRFQERPSQGPIHGRKRSNTGGHVPPPLSFRGFSGPVSTTSSSLHHTQNSIGTAGSSDIYQTQASSSSAWGGVSTTGSGRTSEASSRPGGNFFDAIGTVRMEAFISPLALTRFDEPDEQAELRHLVRRRSKEMRRRASRSRNRDSYHSRGTRGTTGTDDWSRTGAEEDYFSADPFRGF